MSKSLSRALGFDASPVQGSALPEKVFFWLFRTPVPVIWTPVHHRNGVIAFGERSDIVKSLIKRTARVASRTKSSDLAPKTSSRRTKKDFSTTGFLGHGDVVLYDFTGDYADWAQELAEEHLGFSFVYPKNGLEDFLKKLQLFRKNVRAHYENSIYGPLNRRSIVAFVKMSDAQCRALAMDSDLRSEFEDIFINGHKERVHIFFLAPSAELVPKGMLRNSSFTAFLGDENRAFASKVYKLPVWTKNFGNKHVGVIWDSQRPANLTSVVRLEGEHEEWILEKRVELKRQDDEWDEYLQLLDGER